MGEKAAQAVRRLWEKVRTIVKAGNSVCYRKRKVTKEDVQLEPSAGGNPEGLQCSGGKGNLL